MPDSLRWAWGFGVHVGGPELVSVAIARAYVLQKDTVAESEHRDVFAAVEPGWGAARLSLGYMYYVLYGALNYSGRVTAMRHWYKASADYVGVEGAFSIIFGIRAGVFIQTRGPDRGSPLLTADFGILY